MKAPVEEARAQGPLTGLEIEQINAHGPFHHAVWQGRGVTVTQEEALSGRASFLAARIRESVQRHFSPEEIAGLSVLDVGCYDGWILEQLADLGFARMVGIDPRAKNLDKGRRIRELLDIPSCVELRLGGLESLGQGALGEPFDLVLCLGLLHHVESTGDAVRRLRAVCRRLLFVETIVLGARHLTRRARREIETKDVVYFGRDKRCGLSGQKLEGSYYDGSASGLAVVNIPSVDSLELYLEVAGFSRARMIAGPDAYRAVVWRGRRPFQAICLEAVPSAVTPADAGLAAGKEYERSLARADLDPKWIEGLYQAVERGAMPAVLLPGWLGNLARRWKGRDFDRAQREILATLPFHPRDKVRVEYAKLLYRCGEWAGAVVVLEPVVRTLNSDWRSVYRACRLLSLCHEQLGDAREAARYRELCLTANPAFPLDLLDCGAGAAHHV